ncbi:MAG: tyrosine-type recombinase/integrase [Anaerolineales bacterium]|nr:tyrosine-type recombinase/integrase [Anaerolineales bacterium]
MINESSAHINTRTTLPSALLAWEIFLTDQGSSPHTITAFLGDLHLLASYLPPDRQVGEISLADLNNFLRWMENERNVPCSPKTLARRITSLKSFFRWLHEGGAIQANPAEKVVQKSVRSPLPEVLTPDEVTRIIDTAREYRQGPDPDLRSFLLFTLILETGIKKGECLSLSPNHINLDASNGPLVFIRYASPQNRYKERKLPLSEEWIEAYHEYRVQYQLDDRLFPWSARMLEYVLEDLGKDAGITKRVSFSMCRWTSAVQDWRSGIDQNKIRQKLGISEVQFREISRKLHTLSRDQSGEDLTEESTPES